MWPAELAWCYKGPGAVVQGKLQKLGPGSVILSMHSTLETEASAKESHDAFLCPPQPYPLLKP